MLTLLGLGGAGVLSGCSLDSLLDDDRVVGPTEPTGHPIPLIPDQGALLAALVRAGELRTLAEDAAGGAGRRSETVAAALRAHRTQVEVLTRVLTAGGVSLPVDTSTATVTPTPGGDTEVDNGADTGAMTSGPGSADELTSTGRAPTERAEAVRTLARAAAGDVGPTVLTRLAGVSVLNLGMLTAIAGERGALALSLGKKVSWQPLAGPAGGDAAHLLGAFRPAVYGFQVLAARSKKDERDRFEALLQRLQLLTRQLTDLAGDSAGPAPLGYGMSAELDTTAGRSSLAGALLAPIAPTLMARASSYTGNSQAVVGTVRLLAEVSSGGSRWLGPLEAFPGMTGP